VVVCRDIQGQLQRLSRENCASNVGINEQPRYFTRAAAARAVASTLWTQESREFANSLGAVIDNEGARVYDAALKNAFRRGRMIDTPVG
jgi:hypothetical protein